MPHICPFHARAGDAHKAIDDTIIYYDLRLINWMVYVTKILKRRKEHERSNEMKWNIKYMLMPAE